MKKIGLTDTIKCGKNEYVVSDLVNIQGRIFSLIKEGYYFDDEVLKSAHITKTIRDVKTYCTVRDTIPEQLQKLPKETVSTKQIISELNTITNVKGNFNDDEFSSYNNQIDEVSYNEYE